MVEAGVGDTGLTATIGGIPVTVAVSVPAYAAPLAHANNTEQHAACNHNCFITLSPEHATHQLNRSSANVLLEFA
jgi:hypothetical protein